MNRPARARATAIVLGVRRFAILLLVAALSAALAAPAAAAPLVDGPSALPEPPTPELIDRAQERGAISLERATLLRVYALTGDERLPDAYESDAPFDGTPLLIQAREDLVRMDAGPARREVAAALRAPPPDPNLTNCDVLSIRVLPSSRVTDHFYIQYDPTTLEGSLTIDDYAASLELAWNTQVGAFGWAAPPLLSSAPDGRYHVRIDTLGVGLYGFVSSEGTYAGSVGDNGNTAWNDVDADATCMGLNENYSTGFPSAPRASLDATTAHEFNHSLQFGYGALNGSNAPDLHFTEGAATWMEDEVQDASNDNYNFLYPDFESSMGEHDGDEYAYWLTFRGLTERFGTNAAGAGEDVMQGFWERTSRNEPGMLTSLNDALGSKGSSLPRAYHDYAIAAKFVRGCGAGYALPLCFEEGDGYRTATGGQPAPTGSVGTGSTYFGSVQDNYALDWIALPTTGSYDVAVKNTSSAGGRLRVTLACDSGAGIALAPIGTTLGPGEEGTVAGFAPGSCAQPVAAVTNESQTAANPDSSASRGYSVTTTAAPPQTTPIVPPAGEGSSAGTSPPAPAAPAPAPAPAPSTTSRAATSRLAIGKVKVRRNGIVLVRVRVSGTGKLVATSTARARRAPRFRLRRFRVARRTVRPEQGRLLTLRLTANRKARRVIRSQPRRRIRARTKVVFRPASSAPRRTKFKAVTFRLRR